ncbi:MAG: NUDIX domain-containing protein [Aliifodinibius sp.]|nr:NUDIX domain-containing protein [Fodinibius sp.]NIV15619.1 NUDIX domain-containing protein [Fodinibius sp.]NIY29466.1 NUDIX domain-containing protein [Fodinibius sp.]
MAIVEPVTAAGGVVFKSENNIHPSVLLIFRRGVWDLPKGKLEEGETIKECSVREVAEEVGVSVLPEIVFQLPETYHEYQQGGIHYGKTTHWFGMQFPDDSDLTLTPQTEEDIQKVSWISLRKAQTLVGYENLVEVLKAFENQYRKYIS